MNIKWFYGLAILIFFIHEINAKCTSEEDVNNMMIATHIYNEKLSQEYLKAKELYEEASIVYKQKKVKNVEEEALIQALYSKQQNASNRWLSFSSEIRKVGRVSHQKKYEEACDQYMNITKKFGFDLEAAQKKTITMEEIKRDDASRGTNCGLSKATILFMLFSKEVAQRGLSNSKEFKSLSSRSTSLSMQNPNALCLEIKSVTSKLGISYDNLISQASSDLKKTNELVDKRQKEIVKNSKKNKICTVDDAIELSYKQSDFIKKLAHVRDNIIKKLRNADQTTLYNAARIKKLSMKRKEQDKIIQEFDTIFDSDVHRYITNGEYDKACKNYEKLEKTYYAYTFDKKIDLSKNRANASSTSKVNQPKNTTKETNSTHTTQSTEIYDGLANKKYNYLVDIINNFTPRIHDSFKKYTIACGKDKTKRTRPMVDTAMQGVKETIKKFPPKVQKNMKAELAQRYAMYDKAFGYHLVIYYDGSTRDNALKTLDAALSIDRINYANTAIKEYKESILEFMKLYSEAFEYYDMQDYTEDNFKKADTLHAPLIAAYEKVVAGDSAFRQIIEKIEEEQMLERIRQYKKNNQMMFFYVEKSIYLSKKFLTLAHKDDYMKLDSVTMKSLHKTLRIHYSEFKSFKESNHTLFKDNSKYSYYFEKYREYVTVSKKFYIRVKEKKPYNFGEKMLLNGPGRNNIEGSVYQLLKYYNDLVNTYNQLNR